MAKEDSLLLPPELVQVPDRRCSNSLMYERKLSLQFQSHISAHYLAATSTLIPLTAALQSASCATTIDSTT
jgi:hypothetical protein